MRKNRTQLLGRTNFDCRTDLQTHSERRSRLPLHVSVYPYYKSQLGVPKTQPLSKRPLQESLTRSKPQPPPFGSMGRFSQPLLKAKTLDLAESAATSRPVDKYRVTKELEHKKATQETQLVHSATYNTLEGQIDMRKVADIRRTIRRRYANRTDFRKVFNSWDQKSLGVLRPEDVHIMVNKLSIPINLDEARVLVASASHNPAGTLNIQEFMSLIFDDSDSFNVDLSALPVNTERDVEKLNALTVNYNTQKTQSQLLEFLRRHKHGLIPQLLKEDKSKTGNVTFEQFCNVLNNMNLPNSIATKKAWEVLYQELGGNEHCIDYRKALSKITMKDAASDDEPISVQPLKAILEEQDKLLVLDRQTLPVNQLEKLFMKGRIVRKYLREQTNPEEFFEALKATNGSSTVSTKQLEEFVRDRLGKSNRVISDRELEAFLSSFIYNSEGFTSKKEVTDLVFLEDPFVAAKLAEKKRAVPPSRECKDTKVSNDKSGLLSKIYEKMFVEGRQQAYGVFKKLDANNDGYITSDDLIVGLQNNQIAYSSPEIDDLMGQIDPSNKGHVTFAEFMAAVHGNETATNAAQPSTAIIDKQSKTIGRFIEANEALRQSFKPDDTRVDLMLNTRFSATPSHQNTFLNFVPQPNSGLYATERDRLSQKRFEPVNVGSIDKETATKKKENRIMYLQSTHDQITQQLASQDYNQQERYTKKLEKKLKTINDYEARARNFAKTKY